MLPSRHYRQRKAAVDRKRRKQNRIIALAVAGAVSWTVGVFIFAHSIMVKQQDEVMAKATDDKVWPSRVYELWPDDYDSAEFYVTLKSCMPEKKDTEKKKKCIEYIPEGTTTQRIAVVRPPGSLGYIFTKFVQEVVRLHSTNETNLVLLPTSHVPPYGYGKTHGYTKIIRFAAMPLALAAADIVNHFSAKQEQDAHIEDVKQTVRQLVRWHCRLSHVAAHTSLMTLTLEDLIEDPWVMESNVRSFLGLSVTAQNPLHIEEDEFVTSVELIVRHASALLTKLEHATRLPGKLETIFKAVINEELQRTSNLKDWPCLSFWNVGEAPQSEVLSPSARHMAQEFSPNCSAEYSKCTVPRDRCEFKGDAKCKG